MKLADIKPHLRTYSIVQRRKTTINHAFASALAPCDEYDEECLTRAMAALGQTHLDNLRCVYCGESGETWDHLVGLVKDAQLYGYGHQVGNLVPCCRACNSLKGNRDWREFLGSAIPDEAEREEVERVLGEYLRAFAIEVDLARARAERPAEWEQYDQVKQQIIKLMAEADRLAGQLRLQVRPA
jgi:NMD protein affecting ribosome stability and mRNA decay